MGRMSSQGLCVVLAGDLTPRLLPSRVPTVRLAVRALVSRHGGAGRTTEVAANTTKAIDGCHKTTPDSSLPPPGPCFVSPTIFGRSLCDIAFSSTPYLRLSFL